MKAVILARVSTEEQREAGNSLPAQVDRMHHYIERKPELKLDREYVFDESAYKDTRKKFDEVVTYLKAQKETTALCCDKVDRLSRDFLVGLPILEKLRREGKIELHFPSDNLILHQDSPATDLFHFNIAVSLSQYYANSISDNVKRSYEKMRRDGLWTSRPPLGYIRTVDKDNKKTIIRDPVRSHLIIKLFELYASGIHSLDTLRTEAINMGLQSTGGFQTPRSCIDAILKNPFYCGTANPSKYPPYQHKYERLITRGLWEKCRDVREKKRINRPKLANREFVFGGLLHCENCGCLYTPQMKVKKSGLVFIYYSCTDAKGICKRVYVPEKMLLEPIYAILERFEGITQATQEYLVHELHKTTEAEVTFHKAQVNRIRTESDKIQQKIDSLLEAFLDKSITKYIYDKKHQEYYDKLQLLGIELEEHQRADFDYKTTVATVFSVARRAKDIFISSEPHEKRIFLNYLLQNPTVDGKKPMFTLRSPFNLLLELANRPSMGA